jgi:hypothetical protein
MSACSARNDDGKTVLPSSTCDDDREEKSIKIFLKI